MGVTIIRKDSVEELRLKGLGVTPPKDWGDVEQVRAAKLQEAGLACTAAIYAGIDVGGAHYSLTECRMYPAEEFAALAQAATAHVFYHRTYCNHVNAWIARAGLEELEGVTYGAALPEDLAVHMAGVLEAAGGGTDAV